MSRSQVTDLFARQWASYQAVLEHHQVAEASERELERWLATRPTHASAPDLVDLGCGDLALISPLLRRLPLASYTGVDPAQAVLPRAARALGTVPYPTRWQQADLFAWIQDAARQGQIIDILHASFAIHHLDDDDKALVLRAARRVVAPDGIVLWVDVFREPGESRPDAVERYIRRSEGTWQAMVPEQQRQVIDHLSQFDHPADRAGIRAEAEAAGWQWRWAWQGRHRAEAMAVLTPA